jgi:GMP synthase-like glutamine amidotransferase
VLLIENDERDPVGPFGEWLRAAGLQLVMCRPFAGDPVPPDLSGYAGLIAMGGRVSADADDLAPWLPAERALLAEAVATEVPTLGVCLGHQLLALATGGRVGPNPLGLEIGAQLIAKRGAAATDPLFGPLPITPDVIQWHRDAVLELPPGAVLLAASPGCEVQAFRVGRLAWGIQFHIETTPAGVRRWAAANAAEIADYDVPALLERVDKVQPDLAAVWQPFAAAFAGIVRDPAAVRAPRGVRQTTAAPITDPAEIRAALAAQMQAAHDAPHAALPWPEHTAPDAP